MIKKTLTAYQYMVAWLIKSDIQRLLLTSVAFSVALLLARTVYTSQYMFVFLVWNLFLAFLPYCLSHAITLRPAWMESRWKFPLLFIAWLLFIPNSFYMLTDLFHLYDSHAVPRWYDLLLIFCFAWNALLFGTLSVRHMEKLIQARWLYKHAALFIYPVMVLNSIGIYIGRYLRYNSWDIVSDPFRLLADIGRILLHPIRFANAWAMVLFFSVFLTILYTTLRNLGRTLNH